VIVIYQHLSAFVSLLIVLIGVTFLSHQLISWLSRNKFVEPEHETWNVHGYGLVYFGCSNASLSEPNDMFHWHLDECNKFLKEFKENALSAV
jgi:hypothetical protein